MTGSRWLTPPAKIGAPPAEGDPLALDATVTLRKTSAERVYIAGGWIHEFHFLGAVFAGLVILMLLIGKVKPRPEPWIHHATDEVELSPWRFAMPTGLCLLLFVFTIYAMCADFSVLSR